METVYLTTRESDIHTYSDGQIVYITRKTANRMIRQGAHVVQVSDNPTPSGFTEEGHTYAVCVLKQQMDKDYTCQWHTERK